MSFHHGRAIPVVVTCGVVAFFVGCSSASPPPKVAARSDASAACRDLLAMGDAILANESVTTSAAVKTLSAAKASADKAAKLDSTWAVLDGTVKDIATYLESGQRAGLGGTLDDLASYCKPLVDTNSN
jgi:hypothetical protein